ncbi:hypothetical protein FIU82_09850 [Pseudoalteromonas sp. THAF3]|uniref:hypothetical protein n=1 Tax=unclassified Pseudoalteromonas TaxID=194690 RepID=UPI0012695325|nr:MULTISPECIES: hypothetical protein [unclassified Pseudoalteromonas]MCG7544691.1 hypothetical protein [Pseudoalteromonas sp. MM17-2]MCK8123864.1 hypothetical protein [Pseudoalteromonas sp. 2CM39R]QFU05309.1 hypothetical protein FIU82_09850 [Pseudoalteromonas sp. THAF3]
MKKTLLLLMSLSLFACSSTPPKLDANEEFERLYVALGMEEILSSFGGEINISPEKLFSETLSDLPENQKRIFIESMPSKIMTDPINVNAAKVVFRTKLLSLLTAEELKIAADFYSSNVGLKAHRAIIEAEVAVSESLD